MMDKALSLVNGTNLAKFIHYTNNSKQNPGRFLWPIIFYIFEPTATKTDMRVTRKILFAIIFILSSCAGHDRTSSRNDDGAGIGDYSFAVQEVEKNYLGYVLLDAQQKEAYARMRDSLNTQVSVGDISAFDAIGEYLSWFRDPHLRTCSDAHKHLFKKSMDYDAMFDYSPTPVSCKVNADTWLIRFPSCFGDEPDMPWIQQSIREYQKSKCKYLIIDIRGNGGGNDKFFKPYLKLLYDTPCKMEGADFFYTKENLKQMREYFPLRMFFLSLFQNKSRERVLWPFVKTVNIHYLKKNKYPIAAALIIDNGVGSSAEEMVLEIRAASARTAVYGRDPTYGCLDFSNCRPVALPECGRSFLIPMTVSHRWPHQSVDKEGIFPDIIIPLPYPERLHDNIDAWVSWVARDLATK